MADNPNFEKILANISSTFRSHAEVIFRAGVAAGVQQERARLEGARNMMLQAAQHFYPEQPTKTDAVTTKVVAKASSSSKQTKGTSKGAVRAPVQKALSKMRDIHGVDAAAVQAQIAKDDPFNILTVNQVRYVLKDLERGGEAARVKRGVYRPTAKLLASNGAASLL